MAARREGRAGRRTVAVLEGEGRERSGQHRMYFMFTIVHIPSFDALPAHTESLKKGTAMKQLTMAFLRLSVRTLIFFHLDWLC